MAVKWPLMGDTLVQKKRPQLGPRNVLFRSSEFLSIHQKRFIVMVASVANIR